MSINRELEDKLCSYFKNEQGLTYLQREITDTLSNLKKVPNCVYFLFSACVKMDETDLRKA